MSRVKIYKLIFFISLPVLIFLVYEYLSVPLYQLKIIVKHESNEIAAFQGIFSQYIIKSHNLSKLNSESLDGVLTFYIESKNKSDLLDIEKNLGTLTTKNSLVPWKSFEQSYRQCVDETFYCFLDNAVNENISNAQYAKLIFRDSKIVFETSNIRPKPKYYVTALVFLYFSLYLIFNLGTLSERQKKDSISKH
jgi:hypothetical protein